MYTIQQNPFNEYIFHVYLHEDCIFDIHRVCQDLLVELKSQFNSCGGEYIAYTDMVAEIAIYH